MVRGVKISGVVVLGFEFYWSYFRELSFNSSFGPCYIYKYIKNDLIITECDHWQVLEEPSQPEAGEDGAAQPPVKPSEWDSR